VEIYFFHLKKKKEISPALQNNLSRFIGIAKVPQLVPITQEAKAKNQSLQKNCNFAGAPVLNCYF